MTHQENQPRVLRAKRKGSTLVHLQAAIAVGAVVISCVAASIAALYRMQESADQLRERSAVAYRFEHRFREDAWAATKAEQSDDGAVLFTIDDQVVRYAIGEDGQLLRSTKREGGMSYDQMPMPPGVQTTVRYDADKETVSLLIAAAETKPGATPTMQRQVRASIGRPHLEWEDE